MALKKKPDIIQTELITEEDKEQMEKEFISQADKPATFVLTPQGIKRRERGRGRPKKLSYTWKDIPIEKDTVVFSFRIPKKEMQKLKFISLNIEMSLNKLCLMGIRRNNRRILKMFEEEEIIKEKHK